MRAVTYVYDCDNSSNIFDMLPKQSDSFFVLFLGFDDEPTNSNIFIRVVGN